MIMLLEIILRFFSDWRDFRHHRQNWIDLFLAVITTVMQIPSIHNSGAPYAWLTVFQNSANLPRGLGHQDHS